MSTEEIQHLKSDEFIDEIARRAKKGRLPLALGISIFSVALAVGAQLIFFGEFKNEVKHNTIDISALKTEQLFIQNTLSVHGIDIGHLQTAQNFIKDNQDRILKALERTVNLRTNPASNRN